MPSTSARVRQLESAAGFRALVLDREELDASLLLRLAAFSASARFWSLSLADFPLAFAEALMLPGIWS